jgi:ATP-dependent helicase/nuclease subunit A
MPTELRLPFDEPAGPGPRRDRDGEARAFAVDPRSNVVLEASAGTGKTSVLVTRYVNLLAAGVDPGNILAITFTRKAAAEMRRRITERVREEAAQSREHAGTWRALADRLGDIAISTIDAFCLSLLMEFPLEAGLDPAFAVADETEVLRVTDEALDRAMRTARRLAASDEPIALGFALLGERKLRAGLASLLARRLVAGRALGRFVRQDAGTLAAAAATRQLIARFSACFEYAEGGLEQFLADLPDTPRFRLLADDIGTLAGAGPDPDPARVAAALSGVRGYFLTATGGARQRPAAFCRRQLFVSDRAYRRHAEDVTALAPQVTRAIDAHRRELNTIVAGGIWRVFRIARKAYRRRLGAAGLLDFPGLLDRALALLGRMDEFSQSRYRLEARYHHLLIDEFQDTSRAQWRLVSLLVRSWGEGAGLAHEARVPPSIFIVGDRKQSIYAFRDADVTLLDTARRQIERLRPEGRVRRSIARSFRSVPALLAFTNDLFRLVEKVRDRRDAFRFGPSDRFPLDEGVAWSGEALGLAIAPTPVACASAVAAEIEQLLDDGTIRDRQTGVRRSVRPGDVAILFRSRESHREFEEALQAREIPAYVYKGLGFFDADEVKDLVALLQYLADPVSDTRAAALLRSRFVRLSDPALRALAPGVAAALTCEERVPAIGALDEEDRRVLTLLRRHLPGWLALVDRLPPASVLDAILGASAYAHELAGPRSRQARENVKKMRALARRVQNRGYATMARLAEHVTRLSTGDESNAVVDALDAVNLMTVHAAKGLEFPVVFLVNLTRGASGRLDPIRIGSGASTEAEPRQQPLPVVSVGDYRSPADEDSRRREEEETKRLLYVAVTRARDRLYFSAVAKDGRLRAGTGSLAEVLPPAFREWMAQAARGSADRAEWEGVRGRSHRFRICRLPEAAPAPVGQPGRVRDEAETRAEVRDPLTPQPVATPPIISTLPRRLPVTAWLSEILGTSADPHAGPDLKTTEDQALIGTIVHRLFRAVGAGVVEEDEVERRARSVLSAEELVLASDPAAAFRRAASLFLSLRRREDLSVLLEDADCMYEMPFSMLVEPHDQVAMIGAAPAGPQAAVVLRGSIDCLARRRDGSLVVIEVKTGTRTPRHVAQLNVYVAAAARLFPGALVEGRLVYA